MAQVAAIAKLTVVEGKGDELKPIIQDLVAGVNAEEPDTLVYVAHQDNEDPDVFWWYELYESDEAAAAHSAGSALETAAQRMRGLLAGRPETHRMTPLAGKGAPL